ncbi:pyridoxamine 5'-phosphate oxidase family protein [Paenibacillus sp. GCM10023252]|uniref:pyridoxamine 5'-phosphate oxidase family protein n=1 Tax=Paenibacillus sp. GCM10023252 TaxID=3252649 RepID=UPI003614A651
MNHLQLEKEIIEALGRHRYGSLATIEGDKPKARYMAIFHDGLQVYLATNRKTHKVEELQDNPHAFLLFGHEGTGPDEIVELQGTVQITKDETLRHKLWNDELKPWFEGPDDPDYVILNITPSRIEYTGQDQKRKVWEA